MSTGHDESYSGTSAGGGGYGHRSGSAEDPYAAGPAQSDPYATDFAQSDPYATDFAQSDPYATDFAQSDPYATEAYAGDPYAGDPYAGDPQRDAGLSQGWSQAQPAVGTHPAGPPQFGAYQPPLPSSGAAIAGFVISLVSLVMCAGFLSPVGIFFSARGMKDTGPSASSPMGGRGLAIAGLVINILGLIVLLAWLAYVAFLIIVVVIGASTATY